MNLPTRPADPLEWHPWYEARRAELLEWLSTGRDKGTACTALKILYLPAITARQIAAGEPASSEVISVKHRTIQRHRVARPAPWTGRPFHYRWFVGVDDLGRQIATDSRIAYDDGLP